MDVASDIRHIGDIDTRLRFETDTISARTAGDERLRITSGGEVGISPASCTPTAGDMSSGDSQNTPIIHVKGSGTSATGGVYNLLARFEAGGDADGTGAMIVLNHSNDRGLAIQGGRRTGNYAHGALKMIDNVGRVSDAMLIHGGAGQGVDHITFYTGISTTTTERLRITSGGILLKSGQAALNSTSLTHPIQIAADASAQNIVCFGRASDDISAIDFYEADKTTNLGEIQYRQDHVNFRHRVGDIRFATGGTTERLRIASDGKILIGDGNTYTPGSHVHIHGGTTGVQQLRVQNHTSIGSFDGNYGSEFRHATSSANHAMLIHCHENSSSRRTLDISDQGTGIFASFVNGKIKFGPSLIHQLHSQSFSMYPNNGGNNITRLTFSGLVSGCYIAQIGYYNSGGSGYGGAMFFVSGYQTQSYTYDVHEIKRWGGSSSSISSASKYNSTWVIDLTNTHSSYTGGGEVSLYGDASSTCTVSYHS